MYALKEKEIRAPPPSTAIPLPGKTLEKRRDQEVLQSKLNHEMMMSRKRSSYFRDSDSDFKKIRSSSVSPNPPVHRSQEEDAVSQDYETFRAPYLSADHYDAEEINSGDQKFRSSESPMTTHRVPVEEESPLYEDYETHHQISEEGEEEEEINSRERVLDLEQSQKPSQPLFPAVWAGDFTVKTTPSTTTAAIFYGLNACLSTNASTRARRVVENFPATIQWEKVPRSSAWPLEFRSWSCQSRPIDNYVTVFFFPSLSKYEDAYDSLVLDLIRRDSALRAQVKGRKTELLLFPSVELPHPSMRFQGKLFLWGVIRGIQLF